MKTQRNLSFMMPLAVAAMILAGCSDYDNGFTEKQIQFHSDFNHEFGSFDKTQDWNLAERANVTVTTSEMKDINVYTEKEGSFVQVGAFKNVSGTRKLEFDVIEQTKKLVVSDGDVALRAVVGGTVNFDDMTSVKGEVLETRTHDVNRNEWETRYVIPANVTPEEEKKVVAEFRKVREGAYNTVKIDWTRMFVQQVHKGDGVYVDGNGASIGLGSDHMNHLQIYNKKGNNVFNTPAMGGFGNSHWEHVNDFNTGKQNASYEEIMGMTFLYNLDPTDCPTVHVRDGVDWVQQFLYHNSTDSKYHAEYIMLEIDGNYYLGFDFYAHGTDIYSANKNMDVERDWRFDDWIIKVSNAENSIIPVKKLETAQPQAWILAGEDLGGGFDIDYNDVVVKVERVAGENKVRVTPLAAGGTLASYLFFGTTCIGEIHQMLGASPARSGGYSPINLKGSLRQAEPKYVEVGSDWTLSENISMDNNMGGFTIRVLPAGTEAKGPALKYNNTIFNDATDVNSPRRGEAPFIICVPYSYTLANVPQEGKKTTTVWGWPGEGIHISDAYVDFKKWVDDVENNKNWYAYPNKQYIVSTAGLAGSQPVDMTEDEIEYVNDPNNQELNISEENTINGDNGGSTGTQDVVWNIDTSDIVKKLDVYSQIGLQMEVTDGYKYYNAGVQPTFTSSNTDVATVNGDIYNCYIHPIGYGEATITISLPAFGDNKAAVRTIKVTFTGEGGEVDENDTSESSGDTETDKGNEGNEGGNGTTSGDWKTLSGNTYGIEDLLALYGSGSQLEFMVTGNYWDYVNLVPRKQESWGVNTNYELQQKQDGKTQIFLPKAKILEWQSDGYTEVYMQNPFSSVVVKSIP